MPHTSQSPKPFLMFLRPCKKVYSSQLLSLLILPLAWAMSPLHPAICHPLCSWPDSLIPQAPQTQAVCATDLTKGQGKERDFRTYLATTPK